MRKHMTHGSLFSGIGGAEVAAEWMGWENLFHCEINPFGRKVLEYWYPNSTSYEDITKTDFTEWRGRVDVLTAGFPCQPFSVAGHRKGADDDRYLWPQVVRAIHEIKPTWVVGENVAGILTMVQPGEEVEVGNGSTLFGESDRKRVLLRQEYVIETVCRDLEREGYEVRPFVIPACAVGAPHRRDRVWIVARRTAPDSADTRSETLQCGREDGVYAAGVTSHPDLNRQRERAYQQVSVSGCQGASYDCVGCEDGTTSIPSSQRCDNRGDNRRMRQVCGNRERDIEKDKPEWDERKRRTCKNGTTIADTQCFGGREIYNEIQSQQSDGQVTNSDGDERFVTHTTCEQSYRHQFEQQEALRKAESESGGEYSQSCYELPADRWRDFPTQPPVCSRDDGFPISMDGITFSKWRQETIKAYGNAWCVPVAYEIFKAIEETYKDIQP